MNPGNRLKGIFDIRKSELPFALLMFCYFFLVITSFWILKPLKKSLFIEFYDRQGFDLYFWHLSGPQAELVAKILNMVAAFLAVVAFTWFARRFRRQQLTFIFTSFFLASYVAYSFVIDSSGDFTVWSFYLFGDLFSTLMVATFFAFLNDSVSSDTAKRLYGIVGLGGVLGGLLGTTMVRGLIEKIDIAGWLWVTSGLGLMILGVAWAAGRRIEQTLGPEPAQKIVQERESVQVNPAAEGARLVFRSPYLLSIAGIVGLYEVVSVVMDFQFSASVSHYLDGPEIGKQFSTVFAITNAVAMLVQIFITSPVMSRLGVHVALLVLPVASLFASLGFMGLPLLWTGSLLTVADNGFSYSIHQSAKEALYVPTTRDEKYKAKAFIDMFVQRLAKALGVGVSLGITIVFRDISSVRWLTLFTLPAFALWIYAALFAGRRFGLMTEKAAGTSSLPRCR